jgi:hypothetical protein
MLTGSFKHLKLFKSRYVQQAAFPERHNSFVLKGKVIQIVLSETFIEMLLRLWEYHVSRF